MDAKNHDTAPNGGLKSATNDYNQSNGKEKLNALGKKTQMNGRVNHLNAEEETDIEPARKRLCDNE
jgi:hypothetical protein